MVTFRDEPRPQQQQRQTLTVGWGVPAPGPVPVAWEYRSLQTDGSVVTAVDGEVTGLAESRTPLPQALEIMGAERWELVTARDGVDGPIYLFKRPSTGAK